MRSLENLIKNSSAYQIISSDTSVLAQGDKESLEKYASSRDIDLKEDCLLCKILGTNQIVPHRIVYYINGEYGTVEEFKELYHYLLSRVSLVTGVLSKCNQVIDISYIDIKHEDMVTLEHAKESYSNILVQLRDTMRKYKNFFDINHIDIEYQRTTDIPY